MFLMQAVSTLSPRTKQLISDKILYDGSTLSTKQMAEFYLAADAYVSPYRAEGFNLPVLEASACGIPVICTKGGPPMIFSMRDLLLSLIASQRQRIPGGDISSQTSTI